MSPRNDLEGIPAAGHAPAYLCRSPRLKSRLSTTAAWSVLPAIAMVASLGVALDVAATAPARAGTYSGSYTSGITLSSNPAIITATGSVSNSGTAVSGPGPTFWTLANQGTVTSSAGDGVYLFAGTITNYGDITGSTHGVNLGGSGGVNNSGTITGTGTGAAGVILNGANSYLFNSTGSIYGKTTGVVFTGTGANVLMYYGAITGGTGAGVSMTNGGYVALASPTATISGAQYGVKITGAAGTINNSGTITATSGIGVYLGAGGLISGQPGGRINGVTYGVKISGAAGIVGNYGTLMATGATSIGVYLTHGGAIYNGGYSFRSDLISGNSGVRIIGGYGKVRNWGAITGTGSTAVDLGSGGSLYNAGTITGALSGILVGGASGIVKNTGTITGTGSYGVQLAAGGSVNNSGKITGDGDGVSFQAAAGTLVNSGSIYGATLQGVYLGAGGSVTNNIGGTIISAGVTGAGVYLKAGGTVSNSGTISGVGASGTGVEMAAGGFVSNAGYISGIAYGIQSVTAAANAVTVTNSGTIGALGDAVYFAGSGSITNTNDAIIRGDNGVVLKTGGLVSNAGQISAVLTGVSIYGAAATVTNSGTISTTVAGPDTAVVLHTGGTVTNNGLILGGSGVSNGAGGATTVTNTGTIQGGAGAGISLTGAFNNTVVNAGTVTGTSHAIQFSSGNDRLILQSGYSLTGNVDAGTGADTLEFASGTGTFTTTEFLNFETLQVDAGANVTTTGAATLSITNAGTLSNNGTLTLGSPLQLTGAGVLINSGVISNASSGGVTAAAATDVITNTGSITSGSGAGITFIAGGSVANTGGMITGTTTGISILGAAGTVTNSGSIRGTGTTLGVGVYMTAGGSVTNNSGGSIYGHFYGVRNTSGSATVTNSSVITGWEGINLERGGTVINSGVITGIGPTAESGVYLGLGGGSIHNTGTITGRYGLKAPLSSPVTLYNSGTIIGSHYSAVRLGNGNDRVILGSGYSFSGVVDAGGGTNTLEFASGTGALSNLGTEFLNFQDVMVDSGAGLSLGTNGTIAGGITLTNEGSIGNTGTMTVAGVLDNGATFTNSGVVAGGLTNSNGGIITNSGTIAGSSGPGVDMTGDGTLHNTGVIQGAPYGLVARAGDTVTNSGTIEDAGTAGVSLGSGASFTNQSGGLITGVTGVEFTGTGASLANYGTITGTGGTAIQFDAGTNSITLGSGSVLNGNIDGGGGAGQIAFVGSGTIANTIANFGAGSALSIAKGASWTASGSWTIANVSNSGTLQPGTPGTPLKLTGNFAQTSSGTFQTVLDNSGGASELQVTGTTSLAGAVAITPPATLTSPIKYTILTASGGVSGTFSSISGGTALLLPTLSYDANDVFVTVQQAALTSLTNATSNQSATGGGFDAAVKADPTLFGSALAALDTLQTPQLAANLDRLSGENNADLSTVAIIAGRQFITQFQNHALGRAIGDHGWDLWGSGFGQSGHVDGDAGSHRLNEGVSGGAIGAESIILPGFAVGAMVGYGVSHFDIAGGLGEGRMNYTEFALTGDYTSGPLYLTALLGGLNGRGTTSRNVSVPGIAATATGKPDDSQFLGAFEAGYAMDNIEGVNLTPFAGLDFGSVNQDAFTETGGGALNLSAASHRTSSVQSQLGARLFDDLSLGATSLQADLKLAWGHEFAGTARLADLSFSGGTPFTIQGARVPADSALVGLGLNAAIMPGGSAYLHYDGDFAGRAQSHAVSIGLRFDW